MANMIIRTLCLTAGLSEAFTRPGGLPSRGRFEDLLREVANDLKGLSGRMQGPIEVGRCANREANKCCAGSSWDCQAPGSTCSCDQMCADFGDCCPDYQEVCGTAFADECEDREASVSNQAGIMFDEAGDIVPVLVGPEAARVGGDPHYHTFDGNTVHYQGGCTYQITGLCHGSVGSSVNDESLTNFKVYAKNYQRIKEKNNKPMAWINDIIVEIPDAKSTVYVVMGQGLEMSVSHVFPDGAHFSEQINSDNLPYNIQNMDGEIIGLIYMRNAYVRVQIGHDGLVVQFNGQTNFKVNMPCKYNGNVCGLLGNADQDPTNDNVMPNGEIASSDAELGDSWLVNSFPDFLNLNTAQCEPGVSVTDVEPECPAMDLRSAANVCKMIIDPSGPFNTCHDSVPPAEFFEDCVYDTCLFLMNNINTKGAKCDAFQDYAEACREAGSPVDWRDDAKCRVDCPPGSTYDFAHGDTEETCEGTRAVASEGQTAEGCFCDAGHVRSGNNCIENSKCFSSCALDNGVELAIGQSHMNADCSQTCTCVENYFDSTQPPMTECSSDGCRFNENCVASGSTGFCEAIQFNTGIKDAEGLEFGGISFVTEDNLDCLKEQETDAITEWKGGNGGSRATSIWVKPDSCCGSKPYNSGDKSCCGGTHVFDFMTEYCEGGQVFKNNQF